MFLASLCCQQDSDIRYHKKKAKSLVNDHDRSNTRLWKNLKTLRTLFGGPPMAPVSCAMSWTFAYQSFSLADWGLSIIRQYRIWISWLCLQHYKHGSSFLLFAEKRPPVFWHRRKFLVYIFPQVSDIPLGLQHARSILLRKCWPVFIPSSWL